MRPVSGIDNLERELKRERRIRVVLLSSLIAASAIIIASAYLVDYLIFAPQENANAQKTAAASAKPARKEQATREKVSCETAMPSFGRGQSVKFSPRMAPLDRCLLREGWYAPESAFVWQGEQEAEIGFAIGEGVSGVRIDLSALVRDGHTRSTRISLVGGEERIYEFIANERREVLFSLTSQKSPVVMKFVTDRLDAPAEMGLNADERKLGIRLHKLSFF